MSDHSELKKMAEAAVGFTDVSVAPDVLLALIAEVEALRKDAALQDFAGQLLSAYDVLAVEPKITGGDDIPDFTRGSGNKTRRRAEALGIDWAASEAKGSIVFRGVEVKDTDGNILKARIRPDGVLEVQG